MFSANVCLEISLTLKAALKDTLEKVGHEKWMLGCLHM